MKLKRCKKSELIEYIKIYWDNEENREYISRYSKKNGKKIGLGLGCYTDNDKLIGFIFYTPNRYLSAIRKHDSIFQHKDLKVWENNLLEVHHDYRQQGIGSILLQEIYRRMPKDCVLLSISEHTDNHFKFYTKNGFEQDKYQQKSKYGYEYYKFIRYKSK